MKHKIPLHIIELEAQNFHVFVDTEINGTTCRLLVDTGASKTVFDAERVLRFVSEQKITSHESKSVGLGATNMETKAATIKNITAKKFKRKKMEVAILPLAHVNTTYAVLEIPEIDGVLGSDFLMKYRAVIDFGNAQLVLTKRK
jgi:hypothetical protein